MIVLILAGVVWTIYAESLPVAVLTAALIYYRAHRPGKMMQRIRDARYQMQAARVGNDEA